MYHIVPASWDIDYILRKAQTGVLMYSYSGDLGDGTAKLSYEGAQSVYDTIAETIEAYPTTYAVDVLKPRLRAEVTELRYAKMATTVYQDMVVKCDDATITRLTAAVVLMDQTGVEGTRRWKIDEDTWVDLDKAGLVGLGAAIASHMQACFNREEELCVLIGAAETVDDISEINIYEGWASAPDMSA